MRTRVLIAALAAVLSGCTVGPDYKRPEVATPPAWKAAPEATTPSPWPATAWWNGFQSPVLTAYIAQAQRANYDIAAAAARVAQADARAKIAGAALLPAVDAGADVSRSRLSSSTSSSRSARVVTAYNTSLA